MKSKISRAFAALLVLCLLAALWTVSAAADEPQASLTVLFTHDTHDHFYPDAAGVGGYTRLATALKNARAAAGSTPTVTVDAGDFSMGSLFQTVYATDAPELRALGAMGYDVVTFGNHEYDYRPQGLANMLSAAAAARDAGERLPQIVQANYKTPKDPSAQVAVDAMKNFPVNDYTVLTRDGMKVAVFGVMGVDSDECAPMSGMVLEDAIETAKRVVAEIQEKEAPAFIICLSHSGTVGGKGEDYELAKAVDGIDLIVSGHTHTTLDAPIVVNGTPIVSCGEYTKNLGSITLHTDGTFSGYKLTPIDGSIAPDSALETLAQSFKTKVDENYLSRYGLSYDQVLCRASTTFTIPQTGDLIGEAYIQAVKAAEGSAYVPVAFAVAPDGVIRGVLREGDVTTSHAFDILSLGVGADGTPGYPLISVYLTGKDLKNAFEVDASVSALMPAATLYGAGSHWTYNPNRMLLDKVTDSAVLTAGIDGPIDDNKLYRVVADLYSGQMLAAVKSKSFGLLSITPRDESGNEVTDFEARILHDAQGGEVKAWNALATYLESRDTASPVPMSKTVAASWNPVRLLAPMGLPTLVVLVLALLVIALVGFIAWRVTRSARGRKSKTTRGYRRYRG